MLRIWHNSTVGVRIDVDCSEHLRHASPRTTRTFRSPFSPVYNTGVYLPGQQLWVGRYLSASFQLACGTPSACATAPCDAAQRLRPHITTERGGGACVATPFRFPQYALTSRPTTSKVSSQHGGQRHCDGAQSAVRQRSRCRRQRATAQSHNFPRLKKRCENHKSRFWCQYCRSAVKWPSHELRPPAARLFSRRQGGTEARSPHPCGYSRDIYWYLLYTPAVPVGGAST